ncbi:hypothetical protein K7432_012823 [Basidiobolus ranarum]|uniref:Uncharacterized protein n=1 Tax=Basidiobolus ranarum TaxID=34480 RepID=A0ABR2VRT6_9FUNG
MKSFFAYVLVALAAQVSAAPVGSSSKCRGWTVSPLQHAVGQNPVFAANDAVTLKWNVKKSQVKYIREIGLFSAKSKEFLHTQFRSYPGIDATTGQLTFNLSVPLCLQREGEYYLGVYSSTPGNDGDCSTKTPNFKLTADPNGNYTVCN